MVPTAGLNDAGGDVGGDARGRAGQRHADQHAGAQDDGQGALCRRSQPDAKDEQGAANHRDPARPVFVGEYAGDRLAHAPGDLLDGDRQREVRDRDPEFLGGRRLEEAEILTDAHGEGHHQRRSAQHGVGLAGRNLGNVEGFAHGRGRYGRLWRHNQ
jgi:hypothetical protein